jgi:tetrahydromethanopterin S-methyltransferase subunit E
MFEWNLPLRLGLTGIAIVALLSAWLVVRIILRQSFPLLWWGALAVLFGVSAVTVIGSQFTIESHLSAGEGTDR